MTAKVLRNVCAIGNIASGKSTLTKFLAAAIPNSIEIPESFQQNRFLSLYIANPTRWGFTNAVRYFYDYARVYRDLTAGRTYDHCFIDAGGATNRDVYGRYLAEEAIITPDEHAFYLRLCELMEHSYEYPTADAYLFVQASPDTCFERMVERGWAYQTRHVRMSYLETLAKYLDAFADRIRAQATPLLMLESDRLDWRTDAGKRAVLTQVHSFLEETGHA